MKPELTIFIRLSAGQAHMNTSTNAVPAKNTYCNFTANG